jgi:hypothetical protein
MHDYYTAFNPTSPSPDSDDIEAGLNYIADMIRQYMPNTTRFQAMFLNLYFEWIKQNVDRRFGVGEVNPYSVYYALLPIPEMQVYVHDPLEDDWTAFEPTNNFRVDFGFWTGTQLVAVEIDGNEPAGYARDIRRDRLLRRAEVDVIHILNTEIELHQGKVISGLLPRSITRDWLKVEDPYCPFTLAGR